MDKETLAWVASQIQQAQRKRLYGEVTIKFEAGRIVHMQEKRNFKPPLKKDE